MRQSGDSANPADRRTLPHHLRDYAARMQRLPIGGLYTAVATRLYAAAGLADAGSWMAVRCFLLLAARDLEASPETVLPTDPDEARKRLGPTAVAGPDGGAW